MEQLNDVIGSAVDHAAFLLSDLAHEFEYCEDGLRIDLRELPMEIEEVLVSLPVADTACQLSCG